MSSLATPTAGPTPAAVAHDRRWWVLAFLGLAQLMGGGAAQEGLGGVSYVVFLAPALLASGALMTAAVEFSYPVMGGFQWQKTYYAAQATPLTPAQIADGYVDLLL